MTRTKVVTVAIEAESGCPEDQEVADAIAAIPRLGGHVSILNAVTINGGIQ